MNQQRYDLGCRAVGILSGLIKSGALDAIPETRAWVGQTVAAFDATFDDRDDGEAQATDAQLEQQE